MHATVIGWPWSEPAGAARIVTDRYFDNAPRKTTDVNPPQFAAEIAKLETAPPESETQRFNGTGAARPRIVSGLAADLTSMAVLRASAPSFPLTVCTLGGFEQAQRAIHIFNDELPPRSNVKGLVLRAYAEQLDRMLASLARDYPNHMIVVVSPSLLMLSVQVVMSLMRDLRLERYPLLVGKAFRLQVAATDDGHSVVLGELRLERELEVVLVDGLERHVHLHLPAVVGQLALELGHARLGLLVGDLQGAFDASARDLPDARDDRGGASVGDPGFG